MLWQGARRSPKVARPADDRVSGEGNRDEGGEEGGLEHYSWREEIDGLRNTMARALYLLTGHGLVHLI